MLGRYIRNMFIIAQVGAFGCTAALDFDSLSEGDPEKDSDSNPVVEDIDTDKCTLNSDCDDEIDCTIDTCEEDGACSNNPDNSKCGYLEMCSRESGCQDTGKDCKVDKDCDDKTDCTIDTCMNGRCYSDPDDSLCIDENNPCIVGRKCYAGGCTPGKTMECDQSGLGPCRHSVCNEETGECEDQLMNEADNDGDGYLDVECGGDDCNDTKKDVHPEMLELCNLVDDNCDGLIDMTAIAGPTEVQASFELYAPNVAFDGTRYAITWQRGADNNATVYARILGTGECLVDATCEDKSKAAFESIDITPKGGVNTTGLTPSIVAGDDAFFVTWISKDGNDNSKVVLIKLEYNAEGGTPTMWDTAKQLSNSSTTDVFDPQIVWVSNAAGWIAAWNSVSADDNVAVGLIDKSMLADNASAFSGDPLTGKMNNLNLVSLDMDDCVVTYSIEDSSQDVNAEVFEARLGLTNGTWDYLNRWPKIISKALDDSEDPSFHPTVAGIGDEKWVTAYADKNAPMEKSNIQGIQSDNPEKIDAIYADDAFDQIHPELAYDGSGFGLIYIQDTPDGPILDFRLLDGSLDKLESQGSRLTPRVGAYEVNPDEVRTGHLIAANDGFAVAWVESTDSKENDSLYFAAFTGCTVPQPE